MKIISVVGARPQFIKAAVVSRAVNEHNSCGENNKIIEEIILHTGQHYDDNMSELFFREMRIPSPKYYLGIGGGMHGLMTGRMLENIEKVLLIEKPDIIMVYGDTNSTLAAALAGAKLRIPIAHIEAGLRSFNMGMPEEINRILTDRISRWLFCPTETALCNLEREGASLWPEANILNTGDVMFDAALFYREIAVPGQMIRDLLNCYKEVFYLATLHRQENTDDPGRLLQIVDALENIAERVPVVLPLHPRTRKRLAELKMHFKAVHCIEPVGYFDMVCLLNGCKAVFTDSGGVQKEAYFFRKPCITMRNETEWVELVDAGYNYLVGANKEKIIDAEKQLLNTKRDYSGQLYGDGRAGQKIVERLLR